MGMPEIVQIRVNGKDERIPDGLALAQLLLDRHLDRRHLVVEYNGEPLGAAQLEGVQLHAGDRLELVRPVAGG